jgi:hypothetical protein
MCEPGCALFATAAWPKLKTYPKLQMVGVRVGGAFAEPAGRC